MINANRRKHPRIAATAFLNTPVNVQPLEPFFGHCVKGQIIDLSSGGLALLMDELIPQGTRLALDIHFPDRSNVETTIQVIYALPKGRRFLHGMEFLSLPRIMADKIQNMSTDYIDCENRIRNAAEEICRTNCRFFSMCTKPQRNDPVFNVDVSLELAFKSLEGTVLRP